MNLPTFTADASLQYGARIYTERLQPTFSREIVPSIPTSAACDQALAGCDADADPHSPACRLLRHCPDRPRNPTSPTTDNFADYINCVVRCRGHADCIEILC